MTDIKETFRTIAGKEMKLRKDNEFFRKEEEETRRKFEGYDKSCIKEEINHINFCRAQYEATLNFVYVIGIGVFFSFVTISDFVELINNLKQFGLFALDSIISFIISFILFIPIIISSVAVISLSKRIDQCMVREIILKEMLEE